MSQRLAKSLSGSQGVLEEEKLITQVFYSSREDRDKTVLSQEKDEN